MPGRLSVSVTAIVAALVTVAALMAATVAAAKPRPKRTRVEEGGWLNNRWQPYN